MKKHTIKVAVKGSEGKDIRQKVDVLDAPENFEEVLEVFNGASELGQTRLWGFFVAGMESHAKNVQEDGHSEVDFETLVLKGGRRTQAGLITSILELVKKSATVAPELIVDLVNLQVDATNSFKGRADELYIKYAEIYSRYEEKAEDEEN